MASSRTMDRSTLAVSFHRPSGRIMVCHPICCLRLTEGMISIGGRVPEGLDPCIISNATMLSSTPSLQGANMADSDAEGRLKRYSGLKNGSWNWSILPSADSSSAKAASSWFLNKAETESLRRSFLYNIDPHVQDGEGLRENTLPSQHVST